MKQFVLALSLTLLGATMASEDSLVIAQAASETYVEITNRVMPAVVNIRVEAFVQRPRGDQRFFWPFGPPPTEEEPNREFTENGGTGFIVDASGLVITNYHVVANAQKVRITLSDQTVLDAEIVGVDPTTDIAVLRVQGEGPFPTIELETTRKPQVGEWVLAFGNPLDLPFTVTSGIVSARGRRLGILAGTGGAYSVEDYIQTDAAINAGNSGGPLVDLNGKVIGVNAVLASPTGAFTGYGFAIPAELTAKVMEDLVLYGVVLRGIMGVMVEPVSSLDAEAFGLPYPAGAKVVGLSGSKAQPGPAMAAGIHPGDIIWSLNGTLVEDPGTLQRVTALGHPGDVVQVLLYRETHILSFPVVLGERPSEDPLKAPPVTKEEEEPRPLGIDIRPLDDDAWALAERALPSWQAEERPTGFLLGGVQFGSAGWEAGINRYIGYVVISVDGVTLKNPKDFAQVVSKASPGDLVLLGIIGPQGYSNTLPIRVPNP
ncbi:trypsin-like peptidase domain-containing protein [bacterium]|nr:trypsin-like peptidase domain-containing protein [bacterium]